MTSNLFIYGGGFGDELSELCDTHSLKLVKDVKRANFVVIFPGI